MKSKSKKSKNKSSWIWPLIVLILAISLSLSFSMLSELVLSRSTIIIAIIVIFVFITLAILTDMIGLAVASSNIEHFTAMAARKVKGSKQAIHLVKSADKVSSILNDVVGDVCGILSGAAGASIVAKIAIDNGGSFISNSGKNVFSLSDNFKNTYQKFIDGGTYSSNPTDFIKNGYTVVKNSDLKYEVISNTIAVFAQNDANTVTKTITILIMVIFLFILIILNRSKILDLFKLNKRN